MIKRPVISVAPDGTDRAARIRLVRRLSRIMAGACLFASWGLVMAMTAYWLATPVRTLFSHAGIPYLPGTGVPSSVRLLAFAISMVPLAVLTYGFLSARHCFIAFAAGQIFSTEPVRRLMEFSICVALAAFLKPVAGAALSVLLSSTSASGARMLALSFSSDTLIALIFAGTVAVIAWVMAEAIEVNDENQQFI